jgi:hypothetical protein
MQHQHTVAIDLGPTGTKLPGAAPAAIVANPLAICCKIWRARSTPRRTTSVTMQRRDQRTGDIAVMRTALLHQPGQRTLHVGEVAQALTHIHQP